MKVDNPQFGKSLYQTLFETVFNLCLSKRSSHNSQKFDEVFINCGVFHIWVELTRFHTIRSNFKICVIPFHKNRVTDCYANIT